MNLCATVHEKFANSDNEIKCAMKKCKNNCANCDLVANANISFGVDFHCFLPFVVMCDIFVK